VAVAGNSDADYGTAVDQPEDVMGLGDHANERGALP
jgi:hypothetical protein